MSSSPGETGGQRASVSGPGRLTASSPRVTRRLGPLCLPMSVRRGGEQGGGQGLLHAPAPPSLPCSQPQGAAEATRCSFSSPACSGVSAMNAWGNRSSRKTSFLLSV